MAEKKLQEGLSKITTIKLKKATKLRLDHLKEFERESYDELIRKILFILNTLRANPQQSQSVLRAIDSKVKRKEQVSEGIPEISQQKIEKIRKLIRK